MKVLSKKSRYTLMFSVIATLAIVLAFMLMPGFNSTTAIAASGNSSYSTTVNAFTMKLDVNGEDSTTRQEDEVKDIEANNDKSLKVRVLTVNAIFKAFRQANNLADDSSYGTLHYELRLDDEASPIYNSFSNYVTVEKSNISGGTIARSLKITAVQYKESSFTVGVSFVKKTSSDVPADLPDNFTVYIKFEISSTFVPLDILGESQKVTSTFYLADDLNNKANALPLGNNSTQVFSLGSLVGKQLKYTTSSQQALSDATLLKEEINSDNPWVLNDVTRFMVVEDSTLGLGRYADIKLSNNTVDSIAPATMLINVSFSQAQVSAYNAEGGDFWNDTHFLTFTLREKPNGNTVLFKKSVKFTSDLGVPALKTTYSIADALDLNYSSRYQLVDEGAYTVIDGSSDIKLISAASPEEKNQIDTAGYSQVRIKPEYLFDYPSEGKITFNTALTHNDIPILPAGSNIVSVLDIRDEDNLVDYYLVSAKGSGSAVITFEFDYTVGEIDTKKPISAQVVFNVYGKYDDIRKEEIVGRQLQTINVLSDTRFSDIIGDGFYLKSLSQSEASTQVIDAKCNGNDITITPRANGNAQITLRFVNTLGKEIYLDWEVSVNNFEAGALGALDLWKQILIFIAVGIVTLAIILLLVWLFISSISKRRQAENETSAPTSAYIIKLNSTIAAAQAQQRVVTSQAFTAQTQMLALGAGPTTTSAPTPDALQLGAGVPGSQTTTTTTDTASTSSDTGSTTATTEEIYIPLSDDELLERIFVEKYEPRGMARRSFFKSKDLQTRELEKEKARIRDDVRDGMTIEEACRSISERQAARADSATITDTAAEAAPQPQEETLIVVLGFDPDAPLVTEEVAVPAENPDALPEENALAALESKMKLLEKEMSVVNDRLGKTQVQLDKLQSSVDESEDTLKMKEESNASLRKSIEDLEFRLATARGKEKEKLLKEIENKEHVIESNKDIMSKLQDELSRKRERLDAINAVLADYNSRKQLKEAEQEKLLAELEEARENCRLAQELMEKAKRAQAVMEKRGRLHPLLETVNFLDRDIRGIETQVERDTKEKDTVKAEVSDLQKQVLGTTDPSVVSDLTSRMSELNKRVAELDKAIALANKTKADKTIQLNGERRKANEFIDREELEVEDVIAEEDSIIGKMAFDEYMHSTQEERETAEKNLAELQAAYEELVSGFDAQVVDMAVRASAAIKEAEEAVAQTQAAIDEQNAKNETATEDEKLIISIEIMSLEEQLEQRKQALAELQSTSMKEKVEHQMQYDTQVEEFKRQIETAQAAYEEASRKVDESTNKINPLDLILSGSGLISQDRKRMEAENLKKQLEITRSAMEQAKLQAKMAQMDADRAIIDAQRASEESKQEAERAAQEAIARAEEARLAAEQKAADDAEQIRLEMEKVKQETEEERRRLAEEAEQAKREAEEAKLAAEQRATEEAERARREAEEEAERARKASEEEAERIRREVEEEKQKAAEEAERAKREAEQQAEREKNAKEAEEKRIKEKIERKKATILEMREGLKTITDEESAKALKEKFYNELIKLDDDEKSTQELTDLINKCMNDAEHAGEVAMYKALANKAPKRVVKKVTERINKIPRKKPGSAGARPGGARPRPSGARPAGARPRPSGSVRPGGARPRPSGARPGAHPTRPNGSRPRK